MLKRGSEREKQKRKTGENSIEGGAEKKCAFVMMLFIF